MILMHSLSNSLFFQTLTSPVQPSVYDRRWKISGQALEHVSAFFFANDTSNLPPADFDKADSEAKYAQISRLKGSPERALIVTRLRFIGIMSLTKR